ncbi:E3 ubiquitin-protein ligase RAD18 isoform X1 [Takifugu rubripes]|uniref:E3 ubiquitin-protein ligase RAD18 isoform X1 n=1 Tax=Takifugu rubripes TaxID=31033 RepID=UPI0011455579|nr:E3 ubiquitin-protein ligase RAD18 isoform X1 [Takifugu rubripes]
MAFQIELDLPPPLASLKNVENLLRCPICFDFLNITMMTKCSHNFCSLCIRQFFSYKLLCPVCNTQATDQDLRNNRLLDDLVTSFQLARQQLLKVTFESPPISPKSPASAVKCRTPRQKEQACKSSFLSNYFQKKPKTSPSKELWAPSSISLPAEETETGGSRRSNEVDLHSSSTPLVVKEEPMDVEEENLQLLKSVKQESTAWPSPTSALEAAHSSSPPIDIKPIIKVECPVCSVSVPQHFINKHLDTCLTRGEKKESLRSSLGKSKRPMAKLVYNLLSMSELKRRLKECHLSSQGSRDQLVKRHQTFVHIYNAECDSLNPKSAEDIAKEVEASEKIRHRLQGKVQPAMMFSKNQSEREIDELHSNYRKKNSSEFSRLIAQVRGRRETNKPARNTREDAVKEENSAEAHAADKVEPTQCRLPIKVEDRGSDEDPSATSNEWPPSPTSSDVSISSSLSDIFGPEPAANLEETTRTAVHKRRSRSRKEDADASPVPGKRRRKT